MFIAPMMPIEGDPFGCLFRCLFSCAGVARGAVANTVSKHLHGHGMELSETAALLVHIRDGDCRRSGGDERQSKHSRKSSSHHTNTLQGDHHLVPVNPTLTIIIASW